MNTEQQPSNITVTIDNKSEGGFFRFLFNVLLFWLWFNLITICIFTALVLIGTVSGN